MKNNLTHVNFNKNISTMQLRMQFDVDTYIPEHSKVRLVCNIVEEMNLNSILSTYSILGRKPVVDPVTMLKILFFCFSIAILQAIAL
jgi:transposase